MDRREFLRVAGVTAAWPYAALGAQPSGVIVNDIHSQLNFVTSSIFRSSGCPKTPAKKLAPSIPYAVS